MELSSTPDSALNVDRALRSTNETTVHVDHPEQSTVLYRPLLQDEIRVLSILPGKQGEPLKCSLRHHNVIQSEATHAAISYVWGSAEDEFHTCLVNGFHLKLRHNAYRILSRLRLTDVPVEVWIDGLCINQGDDAEKSAQIKLMRDIYQKATRTIVWLGDTGENQKQVKEAVENWKIDELYDDEVKAGIYGRQYIKTFVLDIVKDHAQRMVLIDGVMSLLFVDYWSRVWVRQEAAVGNNIQLLWGTYELNWRQMAVLAWLFVPRTNEEWPDECIGDLDQGRIEDVSNTILSIDRYRSSSLYLRPAKVSVDLLQVAAGRSGFATVPHDKVYAMRGLSISLLAPKERRGEYRFLEPDYSLSWQEVYVNTARFFFSKPDTAGRLLNHAGLCNMGASSDLPTWVPDWRYNPWMFVASNPSGMASSDNESIRASFEILTKKQRPKLLSCPQYNTISPLLNALPKDRCKVSQKSSYMNLRAEEVLGADETCNEATCKDKISRADYKRLESLGRAALVLQLQSCMDDSITYLSRIPDWNGENDFAHPRISQEVLLIDQENRDFLCEQAKICTEGLYITNQSLHNAYDWTLISGQDSRSRAATQELVSTAASWRRWLKKPSTSVSKDHIAYHEAIRLALVFYRSRFAYTANGYMCLVPSFCQLGDRINVFIGYSMPFVIRPVAEWNMLLGRCYVHGMMEGMAGVLTEEFTIKFDEDARKTVIKRPQGDVRANGLKLNAGRYVDILETLGNRWVKLI